MNSQYILQFIIVSIIAAIAGVAAGTQIGTITQTTAQETLETYPVDLSLVGQHRHDRRNVPADQAPSIDIEVLRDPMMPTHFNIKIETQNFTFTPENISSTHVPGEGHAHVFVDDVKISRSYNNWYHLPRLDPGNHTLTVTLNTNDHREYAIDGMTINDTETVHVSPDAEMNMDMGSMSMSN